MNCEEFEIQISQMIDQELEDMETAALFGHMSLCRACREFHLSALQLRSMLQKSDHAVQPTASGYLKGSCARLRGIDKQDLAFLRGSFSMSRTAAVIIATLMLVAGSIASTLLFHVTEESSPERVEYIMMYPTVEVRGFLTNHQSTQ